MSRIGESPISLPDAVKATLKGRSVEVSGPKGALITSLPEGISASLDEGRLLVERSNDTKTSRSLHGLTRSLLANAVHGVSEGYKKELEIVGVGFKAAVEGRTATFNLGHSHPITLAIPEGVEIIVEKGVHVVVQGYDKQKVGQIAAQIRAMRKPEPFKGKGVHYKGEVIKRKAGKAAV